MATTNLVPWNRERVVDVDRRRDDPFWSLRREMNRLFEDFGRGLGLGPLLGPEGFEPRIDVRETDDEVLFTAEIPDKASATYRNGVLSVTLPKAPSARRRVHRIEVRGQ
jgi:HSP20 family molecular chaperone IbpA